MTKGILGRKVGMTQFFTENGELVPVTVVEATPNIVLQLKTIENDGYEAVQLGYQDKRDVFEFIRIFHYFRKCIDIFCFPWFEPLASDFRTCDRRDFGRTYCR